MSHVQDSNLAIASYDMSKFFLYRMQVVQHIAMPILVLAVDQSSWMMSSVVQLPANY